MDIEVLDEIEVIDEKESRSERFKRIAANRVNKTINCIRLIENCSIKSNYEYTPEEVEKMFSAIQSALNRAKSKFTSTKDSAPFSF